MTAILSTLFRRAHAEARSGRRPRMTYRERFRSALRRAWRDAQMKAWEASCRATRVVQGRANVRATGHKLRARYVEQGSGFVPVGAQDLPPRPG